MAEATHVGTDVSRWEQFTDWLQRPVTVARLAVAAPLALLVRGLVMVLSASSVTSFSESGSSYAEGVKQATFAGLGLAGAAVIAFLPVAWIRRLAVPVLLVTIALQALVFTPLGVAAKGNRNWILVGGQTVQPSEFLKLGLVLGGAYLLAHKVPRLREFLHLLVPFVVPVVAICVGLVLAGRDLGSALVLLAVLVVDPPAVVRRDHANPPVEFMKIPALAELAARLVRSMTPAIAPALRLVMRAVICMLLLNCW